VLERSLTSTRRQDNVEFIGHGDGRSVADDA
jgi:hypothetical protein